MTEFPNLDSDVAAVVAGLYRPDAPPLSEFPLDTIRRAVDRLSGRMQPASAMALDVDTEDSRLTTQTGELPVRIYRPAAGVGHRAPVILYFHGGGWVTGNETSSDGICRAISHGSAATVISVGYRLAPEHPFPHGLDDCYAVLSYVDNHRSELSLGTGRLIVAGDSSGANLAASVCLLSRDRDGPPLAGAVLVNPPLDAACRSVSYETNANGYLVTADMMRWYWDCYLGTAPAHRDDPLASPLNAELHDLPPMVVVASGVDPLHDEAVEFARRVRAAGGVAALGDYPGTVHGILMMLGQARAADKALEFVLEQINHFDNGSGDQ